MSRTPAKVTQADIARVLRAMLQTGHRGSLEILPDGTMRIIPDGVQLKDADLDRELEAFDAKHRNEPPIVL